MTKPRIRQGVPSLWGVWSDPMRRSRVRNLRPPTKAELWEGMIPQEFSGPTPRHRYSRAERRERRLRATRRWSQAHVDAHRDWERLPPADSPDPLMHLWRKISGGAL